MNPVKSVQILKENDSMSEEVVLMCDEMYLQKSEDMIGNRLVGVDEQSNLYRGIIFFIMIGLKSCVPYVIKAIPEISITSQRLLAIKGKQENPCKSPSLEDSMHLGLYPLEPFLSWTNYQRQNSYCGE